MREKKITSFSQGTASVLLPRNEKCGERERVRSIFQQIHWNTEDLLCSPYAHALCPITKWWDAAAAPSSSGSITGSATAFGTWGEAFCEMRREESGTACSHSPSALHSGGQHCHGPILGRRPPSPPLEEAATLIPYSDEHYFGCIVGAGSHASSPPCPRAILCPGVCQAAPKPGLGTRKHWARGCRWIWNCVTAPSQMFSGLAPPSRWCFIRPSKKCKDVPTIPLYFADCKITFQSQWVNTKLMLLQEYTINNVKKITDVSDNVQFKHQGFSQWLSSPNFCTSESVLFPASKITPRKLLLIVTSTSCTGSARISF